MKIAFSETNLTDAQWAYLKPLLPKPAKRGRLSVDRRRIIDAILYLVKCGCPWRYLPVDFPHWKTVYHVFRQWCRNNQRAVLNDTLRIFVRKTNGKRSRPTAAILDSQSVKFDGRGGSVGFDAGKRIKGRKRHLFAWLNILWVDGGYTGEAFAQRVKGLRPKLKVEVVKRSDDIKGFKVLPHRWVVERNFGWLMRQRRLVRDYETTDSSAEAMVYIAMIRIQLRRLA